MKTKNITLSQQEKLALISNLSTMISAGIPILSTIDSLLDDTKGNAKKVLEIIRADILQGKQLYVSFAKFPRIFNKVYVNILKASEEAGTMEIALKDLREQIKKDIEFQGKIRSAMVYPIIILLVSLGIFLMILTIVIPRIASMFSQLKVNLPLPTKILIFLSDQLLHNTLVVVSGLLVIIAVAILLFKKKRQWFFNFFYSLPIISQLINQIDLMQFSRSMHLLLTSGITIISALELSEEVVLRKDMTRAIVHAKEAVLAGRTMSSAFKTRKNIFPSLMTRLLEAGEKTGTLEKSLKDISEYFDYKTSETLKTLAVAFEPIMLVIVGIIVGGLMLAIIAPIYNLIGQINPR